MLDDLPQLLAALRTYTNAAVHNGWLPAAAAQWSETADDTARDDPQRPAMVGFFGGTGVGKSSLLNRLAGADVARVGVERPTSREVSMYLHHSVRLDHLPAELPATGVRTAFHRNDAARDVLWLDTPDFDSTETANRDLALRWLPFLDVVIYVVSPERYRDSRGWRWLLEQRQRHLWLFVMNQWDRGDVRQLDDFTDMLRSAGFAAPFLFRTDCRPLDTAAALPAGPDDFDALLQTVREIAAARAHQYLYARRKRLRITALEQLLTERLAGLGEDHAAAALTEHWYSLWALNVPALRDALTAKLNGVGMRRIVDRELAGGSGDYLRALWDDWADTLISDAIEQTLVVGEAQNLPVLPLRARLPQSGDASWQETVLAPLRRHLRAALAQPGHRVQRVLYRLAGLLTLALPLTASSWAAYVAIIGFRDGAARQAPFLDADFVWHAGLLIGLAWAVPFLLQRLLRPSLEHAARSAMRRGLREGLAQLEQQVAAHFRDWREERQDWVARAQRLRENLHQALPPDIELDQDVVKRSLPQPD